MKLLQCLLYSMFAAYSIAAPIPNTNTYHGFIFDVGSTGTRLNIFAIYVDKESKLANHAIEEYPVEFVEKFDCKIPFNSRTDIKKAQTLIDDCIKKAMNEAVQPDLKHQHIWLKFVGTGGLRTLRNANRQKFDELIGGMELYFKSKHFLSPSNMRYVEVISNEAEAQLGYVSSIYKEGTKLVEEKGIIDIGGSSLQVAMPIMKDAKIPTTLTRKVVSLFNSEYNFGILQFPCGGSINIKRYYLLAIMKTMPDLSKPIDSPCHPTGYSTVIDTEEFNNVCTKEIIKDLVIPPNITVRGNSNKYLCEQKLLDAFCSNADAQHNSKCILDGEDKTPISVPNSITIKLMGSWVYFAANLEAQDYTTLLSKMDTMFTEKNCTVGDVERCFVSSYVRFITKFFIKSSDQVEINIKNSGWTLGKMLLDSKYIRLDISNPKVMVVVMILFSLLAALLLFSSCYYFIKGMQQTGRVRPPLTSP